MSTTIEWTATVNADGSVTPGETWNPTGGCDRISPGCAHCYAKEQWDRRHKAFLAGKPMAPQYAQPFEVLQLFPDRLLQPFKWKKPRRVFVNSVSDLFHEDVPDEFIDRVFAVMALANQHTFQILTKRADRMRSYFQGRWHSRVVAEYHAMRERGEASIATDDERQRLQGYAFGSLTCGDHNERFLPNVWLGVSVENQHFADERIPLLLQTPAVVRFISAEPLLGPVDISDYLDPICECPTDSPDPVEHDDSCPAGGGKLDWVIVGGESGNGARPFDLAWARSIVQQCKAAGVACFVKQVGARPTDSRGGYTQFPKDRKGGEPLGWPKELRVREFPEARP